MTPEEKARVKIDKQLDDAGWAIVSRDEYVPGSTEAVMEALMQGNTESDYLLFVDNKAIAVLEAKRKENELDDEVHNQAESYARSPQNWYGLWFSGLIPLVYLANGEKILFKNLLDKDSEYIEIKKMHTPKKMLSMIGQKTEYGVLPKLSDKGLRGCQYRAEVKLENDLKKGENRGLAILATGSGKTYLACLASYRLLNYTPVKRVLFLVDRNNLGKQAEGEFCLFDKTEGGKALNTLYVIKRLKKNNDIDGDIIISTIQKLHAVLTGQVLAESDEDAEDEMNQQENEKAGTEPLKLGKDLKLPPDYFQFIVVDECHRSIYGKWRSVLEYFSGAKILGLTATPTPEAYAFFNKNIVENYTYDASVVDGVNVPNRVYRIKTNTTEHGGSVEDTKVIETSRKNGGEYEVDITGRIDYNPNQLDRSVIDANQIETVLRAYRDAIYTDLYPERKEDWYSIPKTLIFAKDDNHATQIVNIAEKIFGEKFADGKTPEKYVQKITYKAGNSDELIKDLRIDKKFRIAVTVTLVATGTDVKPLEVVMFMSDVNSDILYTQMKGRGCRSLDEDKLREVTPNSNSKELFYIVDAVGVTEHDKTIPNPQAGYGKEQKRLSLEKLLEHISHGDVSDDNLALLRDYCATIHKRYENNDFFGKHLESFIKDYGFAPRTMAGSINNALEAGTLPEYVDPSHDNTDRLLLVDKLISNVQARNKLLEMQKGYYAHVDDNPDKVIYSGFSKETAKNLIENFEAFIEKYKDEIEALRIIYNSDDTEITHSMLVDLRDRLLAEDKLFMPHVIWSNYKVKDGSGCVDELDTKQNMNCLTNLIQIVRYAYKKQDRLYSLHKGLGQRFSLYCGQAQRTLTDDQQAVMKEIADYIVNEGAFTVIELNKINTDLWRRSVKSFGNIKTLESEITTLSRFVLRAA